MDFTAASALRALAKQMKKTGQGRAPANQNWSKWCFQIPCLFSNISRLQTPHLSFTLLASQVLSLLPTFCTTSFLVNFLLKILTGECTRAQAAVYFCNVSEDIEAVLQGADPSLFVSYVNISDAEQKIRNSS